MLHQKDVPMTPASNYGKIAAIPEHEPFARDSVGYEVGNINKHCICIRRKLEKSNIDS
jgi:hypothetical protein